MAISIRTPEDIEKMRVAGRLAAEVLEMIEPYVKPGVSTGELDRICNDYIVNEQHAVSACLGYHGYPKSFASLLMKWCAARYPGRRQAAERWRYR